jgi:hypothetical protein
LGPRCIVAGFVEVTHYYRPAGLPLRSWRETFPT